MGLASQALEGSEGAFLDPGGTLEGPPGSVLVDETVPVIEFTR